MTREHFNRDNLVVLDFRSIQQSRRFASPFKFSIRSKPPNFFSFLFSRLDFLTFTMICQMARRWLVHDREWKRQTLLDYPFSISFTKSIDTTATNCIDELRKRRIAVDESNSMHFEVSLLPHCIPAIIIHLPNVTNCCYQLLFDKFFSRFSIHALGVSRKKWNEYFVRYESIVLSTSLNFN